MQEFTARYGDKIQGVLSGFDRLIFRGTLRKIAYECGMKGYLWANRILFKDFGSHAHEVSERVKRAALRCVEEAGRRIQYLPSSKDDKEEIARGIAEQEYITQGPVCALTCVEPCIGFDIHRNRESKQLELVQMSFRISVLGTPGSGMDARTHSNLVSIFHPDRHKWSSMVSPSND